MSVPMKIAATRRAVMHPAVHILPGYMLIAGFALKNYIAFQSLNCLLGFSALLFVWRSHPKEKRSCRFAWAALVFLVLCVLLPVKTLLYFTICFAVLFFTESFYGKTGILPLFAMILLSPVFPYAVDTFSFPVRLGLTQLAGSFFNAAGMDTMVKGNMIVHGGNEFSVDPGCMGLSMMEASILLGMMIIAFYQQRFRQKLSNTSLLVYFGLIMLLNITANLFRILVLVHFAIFPATVSHEIAGIACLLLYVFVPAVFLARFFVRRSCRQTTVQPLPAGFSSRSLFIHSALLAATATLAVYVTQADTYKKPDLSFLKDTGGYSAELSAPGIVKLQDSGVLIYIKYIRGFYDTDHNPMICWKGSGYVFEQVQHEEINGNDIYTARLTDGRDQLYSAWWYSNGTVVTASQLTWRWNMLKSRDNYALVNVTCATKKDLDTAIRKITADSILASFFSNSIYH